MGAVFGAEKASQTAPFSFHDTTKGGNRHGEDSRQGQAVYD